MESASKYTLTRLFFSYSRSQRIGVLILFVIIIVLQMLYCFVRFDDSKIIEDDKRKWLANQSGIDSLILEKTNYKPVIYPFNPNFITDFKGYKLGMSVAEIDRLTEFRKQNKYVNSAAEFQAVTKVSDSLLNVISPYFKFPDWVKSKKNTFIPYEKKEFGKKDKLDVLDINTASKEDLMKIYGIGDKLSDRILEQREKYGAFVSMEQLQDIWGLSQEVIEKLHSAFVVKSMEHAKKININSASVKELSQFPFFRYQLAKDIVVYRSMNGDIKAEDLTKIKGFPSDKVKIIALYLEF
jgi:competence ComEA-like helix-hairpin-helix protein